MDCSTRVWPKWLVFVSLVFLFSSCAQTAKDTPAAFTDSAIPSGYSFPHPANVADPTVHGTWVTQSGKTLCLDCHKTDTNTTLPGPRCDSCHANYPHADGWVGKEVHGKYVIDSGTTTCQACHGSDLAGGISTVSCTTCHETYPHVADWQTDTSHLHGASARTDKNVCKLCHGETFTGGQSAVKCSDCHAPYPHADSWVAATGAASVHGPLVDVEGSTQCEGCHGTNNTGSIFSSYCSDCHNQHLSTPTTCKGCHEAGKGLPAGSYRPSETEKNHLTTQDCASCHDYATGDFKILKGETIDFTQSRHGVSAVGVIGAFAAESNSTSCMRCHTATGFKSYLHNGTQDAAVLGNDVADPLTCAACHNADTSTYSSGVTIDTNGFVPGDNPAIYKILGIDGEGTGKHIELTTNGMEGLCVKCHAPRSSDGAIKVNAWVYGLVADTVYTSASKYYYAQYPANNTATPAGTKSSQQSRGASVTFHYYPVMAVFYGNDAKEGFQYEGKSYVGKNDLMPGYGTCITCHNPHTTEVQPAKCSPCHVGVTASTAGATATAEFHNIRVTTSDYDGDTNTTESTYTEVEGVKAKLLEAIVSYALNVPAGSTGIQLVSGSWKKASDASANFILWTPRLVKAAYNYHLSYRSPGAYVHNSKYMVELLYDSIEDLNAGLDATGHPGNKVDMSGMVRP